MEFLAEHQLYIVMIIVVGIWLGLFAYLFRLEGKIRKLEKEADRES